MKWLIASLLALTLVFLTACGDGDTDGGPSSSGTSTRPPASDPPTVTQGPLPTLPADIEQKLSECVSDARTSAVAESSVATCLTNLGLSAQVKAADGELPVILVDVEPAHCLPSKRSFFVWRDDSAADWKLQSLDSFFGTNPYDRINDIGPAIRSDSSMSAGARVAKVSDQFEMGVVFATAWCGSGPRESYSLFRLEEGTWRSIWTAQLPEISGLSHTNIDFVGEGIGELKVVGDSWLLEDAKSKTFHESNPGPHRYVEQTWVRNGDGYVMSSELVQPSAYNSLVEFIFQLSSGDEAGALSYVAEPGLLDKARELGLVQEPLGQRWLTNLDSQTVCCGPIYIFEGPPGGVKISFAETNNWIISAIESCTVSRDDTGTHCC